MLVEYDEHLTDLQDLLSEVADLELPDLPGEDRPTHPLDPGPLVQSSSRTIGAALGLALIAARRITGASATGAAATRFATAAGVIGLLQGFPFIRNGLRALLGRNVADLVFNGAGIVTLALSGSPLGLLATGAEALSLLNEVVSRRAAWRRYEQRLGGAAAAEPGAEIRLEAGERSPLGPRSSRGPARPSGATGCRSTCAPALTVPAGRALSGGPFVLRLQGDGPFTPGPRPAPPAATFYNRYVRVLGPVSLAYAALTAILTRSPGRTFEALLLVNPRTAVIGMEAANLQASARVLRGGVTVVGTRPDRVIRRPDLLLLGSPRVLTDGVELTSVLPWCDGCTAAEMQSIAAGVAAAAGSPWGSAFPQREHAPAADGAFDGHHRNGRRRGRPLQRWARPSRPTRARRTPSSAACGGEYHLLLYRLEGDRPEKPLGLFALRPRLAAGVSELVETCRRHGVALAVLPGGDAEATRALRERAGVEVLDDGRPRRASSGNDQQSGGLVFFVTDAAPTPPRRSPPATWPSACPPAATAASPPAPTCWPPT